MKRHLLLAAFALAITSPVLTLAEGPGKRPGMDVDARVKAWTQKLDLTTEQQSQLRGILETKKAALEKSERDIRDANEKAKADIQSILTPEQKAKFEAMKEKGEERREKRKEKREGRRG